MLKFDTARAILCLALTFLIYVVVFGESLINRGGFDDDRLYLYSANFLVCEPDAWDRASRDVLDYLGRGPYDDEYISRFQFRFDYSSNYLLHAATTCLARHLLPQDMTGLDYGSWVYTVLEVGVGIGHLLCLLIVLAAVWMTRHTEAPVVVLATFAVMAALAVGTNDWDWHVHGHWRLLEVQSFLGRLIYTAIFAISPGIEFNIFGLTPRSAVTLLLVAVTILRWDGRNAAAYWILAASFFVHGTYGTLALVMFVGLDAVRQPAVLRERRNLVPIAFSVVVAILDIRSFDAFGGTAIQLGALAAIVGAFSILVSPFGEHVSGKIPPIGWCRRTRPIYSETLLFLIGMCMTLLVSAGLAAISSGLAAKYIAHELAGRPIAMMRVPFMLGLCAIVMRIRFGGLAILWPTAAAILALYVIGATLFQTFPVKKTWLRDHEMRARIDQSLAQPSVPIPENELYFALSCHLDRQCAYMRTMLSARHR